MKMWAPQGHLWAEFRINIGIFWGIKDLFTLRPLRFARQLNDAVIEVTHRAHEPDRLEIERHQAVDLWITPITTTENTHSFRREGKIQNLTHLLRCCLLKDS
jgi:hypothetical protein